MTTPAAVRIAVAQNQVGLGGRMQDLAEDGTPLSPPETVPDLARAVARREAECGPRWVWASADDLYPRLLDRLPALIGRCHDVKLVETLLLGHRELHRRPRSLGAALARLHDLPEPDDALGHRVGRAARAQERGVVDDDDRAQRSRRARVGQERGQVRGRGAASLPRPQALRQHPEAHHVLEEPDGAVDPALVGEVGLARLLAEDGRVELEPDQRPRAKISSREDGAAGADGLHSAL